jgi:hypothetical protein
MVMPTPNEADYGRLAGNPKPTVEFFSIELAPQSAGQFHVGIFATLCEQEGDLTRMDLGSHRAASLDDALSVVRIALHHH